MRAMLTSSDATAALAAACEHFSPQMEATMRDIRRLLAGCGPQQLVGRECLWHVVLRARFNELASAQRDFAEAHFLARRQQRQLTSEQMGNRRIARRHISELPQFAAIYG